MAKQERTVRVGFIGAGGICQNRHIPELRKIEGVEIVAVCNRSPESSAAVAQKCDIPHTETDWRALVARNDVDAVFIGTWPYMHREMSVATLEAGKHVFCQARMAMDLADARAMLAAAEARPELVNMVCPAPHPMPWTPYVRRAVADGTLGELLAVRAVSINGSSLGKGVTWREKVEYSGRHALALGIVAEVLNDWVGDYATLTAHTATPIPTKTDGEGNRHDIGVPQVIDVAGTLTSGVTVSEHHSGVDPAQKEGSITLAGTEAVLRVDMMRQIRLSRGGGPLEEVDVPEELKRPWRVERDFVEAVRAAMDGARPEDRPISPDFAEGARYMAKVEAVHRSAEAGRPVELSTL